MQTPAPWRARLRPEYRWPYPALDPDQWYAVRSSWAALEQGKSIWLDSEPYAVEVLADHLEPLRIDVPSTDAASPVLLDEEAIGAPVVLRVGRLKARAASLYKALPLGVWVVASALADVAAVSQPDSADPTERRRRRLRPEHFEFRNETIEREQG